MSFLLLGFYALLLSGDGQAPQFSTAQNWIVASPPAQLLHHPQVLQNLSSGLTTTIRLQIEVRVDGDWQKGGALIDIRFEPWDEVYYIHLATMDGEIKSETLESMAALVAWWQALRLRVLAWRDNLIPPSAVRASLEVIPFSASEQNEAREWFASNSALSNTPESNEASGSLAEPGLINLIVATSIKRRVIFRQRWRTLAVAP